VDKLEQERSQLKMDNDRLEQRVSEVVGKIVPNDDRAVFFRVRPFGNRSTACAFSVPSRLTIPLPPAAAAAAATRRNPVGCLFLRDRYFKTRPTKQWRDDTRARISFGRPTLPQTLLSRKSSRPCPLPWSSYTAARVPATTMFTPALMRRRFGVTPSRSVSRSVSPLSYRSCHSNADNKSEFNAAKLLQLLHENEVFGFITTIRDVEFEK